MPRKKKTNVVNNSAAEASIFGLDSEDTTDESDNNVVAAAASMFGLDSEDATDESENDLSQQQASARNDDSQFVDEIMDAKSTEDAGDEIVERMASLFFEGNKRKSTLKKPPPEKKKQSKTIVDDEALLSIDVPFVAVRNLLHNADEQLPDQIKTLPMQYRNAYHRWLFYLSEGFNVLLNGYGSKKAILDDFCLQKLANCYSHMVVRGYLPTLRFKDLILNLAENLDVKLESTSNIVLLVRRFTEELDKRPDAPDVVLVVHNIEGPSLRDGDVQSALSHLAESKYLHIIASVDNVNAASMWDLEKLERFRWLSFDTPTYSSYVEEIVALGSSKVLGLSSKNSSNLHNLTSLNSVWASLTENARQMFTILASNQKNRNVSFWDLYRICRDEFVVNSETALRQQLVEFEDHNLIVRRTGLDGGEMLEIAVEQNVLKQFLAERNCSEEEESDASS